MEQLPERDLSPADDVPRPFPVVGIGASAGGLAAIGSFLSSMPDRPEGGMAFVLVQHLAPDHVSILGDLVRRYTRMEVFEVEDGMEVRPDCVYVIPPNRDLSLLEGRLRLLPPSAPRGLRLPIDFFFRSLAQDQRERAICVVLSGTGGDGTLGVRAVKGEGGMVMAQDPATTEFDGMPRSAIATGLVDFVLPPGEMPRHLLSYVAHAFGKRVRPSTLPVTKTDQARAAICAVLRDGTGHDFSQYKETTILRRADRRMALHQIERPDEYLRFLRETPKEVEALFKDLLIGVTSFFRDREAFEVLRSTVVPRLFAGRPAGSTVRAWVCGCSTGEEAYSIAILLQEHIEALREPFKAVVFATDVDGGAIEHARAGVYPAGIAEDVPADLLARFFVHERDAGTFRIQKAIREMVVFSEQDVIRDPPFSRLDLVSCRNLLIYFGANLQKRLIPLFHYALRPDGVLFLGGAESVGEPSALFTPLDRKWKLFARLEGVPDVSRLAFGGFAASRGEPGGRPTLARDAVRNAVRPSFREVTEQSLLSHHAQAGVLVKGNGTILHLYGRAGKYLELAPGDAGMNVLQMAREGLRRELAAALRLAAARKEPVREQGLRVTTEGGTVAIELTVRPATGPGASLAEDLFLVVLEETPPVEGGSPLRADTGDGRGEMPPVAATGPDPELEDRVLALERELRAREEYLQTTLEQMETANEELQSTNEEMQSVNEELQSTNEELETSKEELQSLNEELATVNAELQASVAELSRANNDMNNLFAGTGIGTLFVDLQLRIWRFTPDVTRVVNLIPSDVGRPLAHVVSNLTSPGRLVEEAEAVLADLVPREAEVEARTGAWYLMRIRPYRTLENRIEGAVLTFVDVTERRRLEDERQKSSEALRTAKEELERTNADLERRNADLDAFSATVAHDLREALSSIVGFADLALEKAPVMTREEGTEFLGKVRASARRMAGIIDSLLLLGGVRKAVFRPEPLDMASIVSAALRRLEFQVDASHATVVVPDRWPAAVGYGPWVEGVWVNLISNALKHGGTSPRLELGARAEGADAVRFWLRDDGPGIPVAARSSLFLPFSRGTDLAVDGHGLGLSIVDRIVSRLGGSVAVESEVGKGSVFSFTLPAPAPPPA